MMQMPPSVFNLKGNCTLDTVLKILGLVSLEYGSNDVIEAHAMRMVYVHDVSTSQGSSGVCMHTSFL